MRFGLRNKLALFLVITLVTVQGLTGVVVYVATRGILIENGKEQLRRSADLFLRQLDVRTQRIADGAEILASDFPLRQAVASNDRPTIRSALQNHGRRVGATRMLLVNLEGMVELDTLPPGVEGVEFAFPDLLDAAFAGERAASTVVLDDTAFWVVVLPVMAPMPIAYIAAAIPLDDALLDDLQRQSPLPLSIGLALDRDGVWSPIAGAGQLAGGLQRLRPPGASVPVDATVTPVDGTDALVLAAPLATTPGSAQVLAVLRFPLAEALAPYRNLAIAIVGLAAVGLLIALVGTVGIARGVTRPLGALAAVAGRIAAGDYTPPAARARGDEIGQLSDALSQMADAIRERERRIRHQAAHDAATGLPNRVDLLQRMSELRTCALVALSPRRQREIVDTLGQEWGDRVIAATADRIAQALRDRVSDPSERPQIARIGDGTLGLLLPRADIAGAIGSASAAVAALERPLCVDGLSLDVAAAAGISASPDHGVPGVDLLKFANVALADAMRKETGIAVYDPAGDPHRPERLSLMSELRDAIERGELTLFYQPKVVPATGRTVGAEALVRWFHPTRGFVPPDDFIPLAEETGTISLLSRWAVATAAAQAARWRDRGLDLTVAVNISARDLGDAGLPERIAESLAEHRLPADRMVIEITESAIMGEPDAAIAVLQRIAQQGIRLAIDDFGVGQSSLAYLRKLPVTEMKIDKSFILKLADSTDDQAIVRTISDLARTLGYVVTAEGVEDARALGHLAAAGVDYAQGYHMSRPLPPDAFDAFLADGRWPAAIPALVT
jgi:EAL domain-containing protein (putative c-di-GMP-specific phosphodiesterase class I)/GGDEF domain-containing protein